MENSRSREADSHSDGQEIPYLLCNLKARYRVHKSLTILTPTFTRYYFKIHFNIILQRTSIYS